MRVIERAGSSVGVASTPGRPLCCGRTYLSTGMTDRAIAEMTRTTYAFRTALDRGKTIVGLEPSCTLMFRDEAPNLIPDWTEEMGSRVLTFPEYMSAHPIDDTAVTETDILVHVHCHQKAMGVAGATVDSLNAIEGLTASMIDSSCCGMAGFFGYQRDTDKVSRDMAELSLAPAVRSAGPKTLIVADGFSCRCQIRDVTDQSAVSSSVAIDMTLRIRT